MSSDGLTAAERRLLVAFRDHELPRRRWRFDPRILAGPLLPMVADAIEALGLTYPTPPFMVAVAAAGCVDGARGAWLAAVVGLGIESYAPPPGPHYFYQVYPLLIALCFSAIRYLGPPRRSGIARIRRSVFSTSSSARSSSAIGRPLASLSTSIL